ncbi:midasin-like [Sinocyclocheilus grahami]|uniref:midasin-like n=1 Tax=Sinocyclocheilus grahami TaxID=75366 RepID=UPI0007ACF1F7|nr:PREDICTED: midasin-like [Sinocyclocheilus grahami]
MAVIKFLVYITCFCLSQDLVFCDDYGESGNEITLTPSIRGKPEDILWIHNNNKVLEYDGSQVLKYGSFKDRVDVDFETGQLKIRKLSSQDSGKYQSEISINGKVQTSSHTLTVLDALPDPQVTCELDETSNLKKLYCSVESQTQTSYEWSGPNIKQLGPTLLVDEQEKNRDSVYTCTVKNKAGSRTTDFTLQDCRTGGVSPPVLFPVLIVAVLLVIVFAALALFLYRRKKQQSRKSELKKMDSENGECDNLLRNVPTEAMPGSSDATLPCRTRLTAPKESIADKNWDQDSGLENVGETHEGQKLLKESPQSAITEKNNEDSRNTNEGELDKNEKNRENADEAEENGNSKPDETDRERHKLLQIQEEMEKEKSQIESPEEQIETQDADKNEEDQTPGEKKEEEEEEKAIDRLNTDSPANLEKAPINISVPSSNQTGLSKCTDQDINMEEESTFPGVEQKEKEKVLTNEELKGGQEQMPEENKHDPELSEPKNSINLDKQGKQTDPDSTIQYNSVSQQQCHNDGLPQKEDDDAEQTDKSRETEQGMKQKNDVPETTETKDNKHLKDCDEKNSDPDNTNNDMSVPEDKKAETETDSFSKHAMKETHSSEIREQDLNKQCNTECNDTVYSEGGEMGSVLSAVKEEQKNICQLEPREGSSVSCATENTRGSSKIIEDEGNNDDTPQQVKKDGERVLGEGVEEK